MKMKRFWTAPGATLLAMSAIGARAQPPTVTVIHEFSSSDQSQPASNLIEMPDGAFLGMTGAPIDGTNNAASIYLLKANGEFTTLFQFSPGGSQCASGAPNLTSTPGALTHASDGNLYGVCYAGGQYGQGSVFRLTTSWQLTDLHDFQGSDGSQPSGPLVEGTDGNLYGVTLYGGLSSEFGGTIFRVGLSGEFATVYEFNSNTGGTNPNAGLARGPSGNLYGMYKLGLGNPFPGPGGDYRIDHQGNITFPAFFQSSPSAFAPVITSNGDLYALNQPSNFVGNGNKTLEVIRPGSSEAAWY